MPRQVQPDVWQHTPQEVTRDLLGRLGLASSFFWWGAGLLLILSALGLIGLLGLSLENWGYFAASFAFILSTAQGAPLVAVALRLTKSHWGRPIYRLADLFALGGVVTFPMFLRLSAQVPGEWRQFRLWFGWPAGAPEFWDGLSLASLTLVGLGILYLGALPDLAAASSRWALGWRGTPRQWRVLRLGLGLLGIFYLMAFVISHTLMSTEFAMSLVPQWRSAIFPAYHAVTGIQGGVATTLVTMLWLRHAGGLRPYLGVDQFWGMAKILLALSLLWFYFWWSEFITMWYGRTPAEQAVLDQLTFGPYLLPFVLTFALCFAVPLLALMWNPVRQSIWGPGLVAAGVLVGLLLDRMRLYGAAFATGGGPQFPTGADLLIMGGALAAVGLLYMLASRVVPLISLWEVTEGLLLRRERLRWGAPRTVIVKPE